MGSWSVPAGVLLRPSPRSLSRGRGGPGRNRAKAPLPVARDEGEDPGQGAPAWPGFPIQSRPVSASRLPPPPPVHQAGPRGAGEDAADRRSYRRARRRRSMRRSWTTCSTGCGRGTSSCGSPGRSTRGRRFRQAPVPGVRQEGSDLGERLYRALCRRGGRRPARWRRWGATIRRSRWSWSHRAFERGRGRRRRGAGPGRGRRLLSDRPARRRRGAAAVRGDRLEHRPGPRRDPRALPRAGAHRRAAARGRRTSTPRTTCAGWPRAWPDDDLGCPRTRALLASLGFLQSKIQIQNPKWKRVPHEDSYRRGDARGRPRRHRGARASPAWC